MVRVITQFASWTQITEFQCSQFQRGGGWERGAIEGAGTVSVLLTRTPSSRGQQRGADKTGVMER
eukprot:6906308-Prymnesium_polylepis.1